ncbi:MULTISPECIES: anti-sigma factor [Rhodanobacter]|uniref:anti-sigma factor n=1 Tax=Rhodanobacter TaxID=75309 RepID=UPI0003F7F674|nr:MULTISPECIES: anti-sigma factor [Rhodanobacter]KZC21761.1 anti-sigma factor [Rhodanobacter denitrificans]UJJ52421.1 anti-sigma factor [Rhodanobacter denitrificans]UJM95174.1 anti-sigma factor [Rhodanobacter denitrificans]UJM98705.1 anti-sigma factor [Rhodanobacter denitrificans]UJN21880.1 anti-sigma factor [Rhodanobacter denitrificans]
MNTPTDHRDDNLRHAEYVLGVLDAAARAAVEREIRDDPQAAAAVAAWQRRLMPLTDEVEASTPAPYVWARIRDALQLAEPAVPRPRPGLWNNLNLWRWLGLGASVVATASVVVMLAQPHRATTPTTTRAGYMAATIEQDNGVTGWTATMDLQHARMIVVPATPVAFAPGRTPQLWLIPPGEKPVSLGVIARDRPTSIALRADLLARLDARALLAVSVEPSGGSPTGQPTGPVVAKGAIGGT